jgi:hypothetical protein
MENNELRNGKQEEILTPEQKQERIRFLRLVITTVGNALNQAEELKSQAPHDMKSQLEAQEYVDTETRKLEEEQKELNDLLAE